MLPNKFSIRRLRRMKKYMPDIYIYSRVYFNLNIIKKQIVNIYIFIANKYRWVREKKSWNTTTATAIQEFSKNKELVVVLYIYASDLFFTDQIKYTFFLYFQKINNKNQKNKLRLRIFVYVKQFLEKINK